MLNKGKRQRERYSPETQGVAESYEMAYRMQFSMPEIMDYEKEKSSVKKVGRWLIKLSASLTCFDPFATSGPSTSNKDSSMGNLIMAKTKIE